MRLGKVAALVLLSIPALYLVRVGGAQAGVRAVVSIPPQQYFVEKVGGGLVEVTVMVPPGANAHTYEPRPRQMTALSKADVYFSIGVEFEKTWLGRFKAAHRNLLLIDTAKDIRRIPMESRQGSGHDGREQPGSDPHIWLSPRLVALQAQAVRDGLVRADPAHQAVFEENLTAFQKELRLLDEELRSGFRGLGEHKRILVFHPAWGYFCRDYGLVQVAVEKEGKEPTARGMKHLIEQARESGAKIIFVQPQFSTRAAETVAQAVGGRVVRLDPLAQDWADNMKKVARLLRKAIF